MKPGAILETGLYCEDLEAAETFFRAVFGLEGAGHINSASGLGNWLQGYALLGTL